jgi:class 3 adenylate cyclase
MDEQWQDPVNRHFDFIRQAVGRGGGSVIKTMGDGVMCAFYRLDDAVGTAIGLQGQVGAWCRELGIDPPLALKIGVHHGPAIAMTANDHLDYFGRTVNLAARLADQSRVSTATSDSARSVTPRPSADRNRTIGLPLLIRSSWEQESGKVTPGSRCPRVTCTTPG